MKLIECTEDWGWLKQVELMAIHNRFQFVIHCQGKNYVFLQLIFGKGCYGTGDRGIAVFSLNESKLNQ